MVRALKHQHPRPRSRAAQPSYPLAVGLGIAMVLAACSGQVDPDESNPAGGLVGGWSSGGTAGAAGPGGAGSG